MRKARVHDRTHERSGTENQGLTPEPESRTGRDTDNPSFPPILCRICMNAGNGILNHGQTLKPQDSRLGLPGIPFAVVLTPWRPDSRPLRSVQHPKLDPRGIRNLPHLTAKGVDLPDKVPLGRSPNGGVARHSANSLFLHRHHQHRTSHSCRSHRGLDACVSAANYNRVICGPNLRHELKCVSRETFLFADAEFRKDLIENIVRRNSSGNLPQAIQGSSQVDGQKLAALTRL